MIFSELDKGGDDDDMNDADQSEEDPSDHEVSSNGQESRIKCKIHDFVSPIKTKLECTEL